MTTTDPVNTSLFWKDKTLAELNPEEWEALCDGCGRCCLHKLEDEDTGVFYLTNVACRLLDQHSARCRHYADRHRYVPDCVQLTPDNVSACHWLPETCAYRRRAEGRDVPAWHPLVSGQTAAVHRLGVSVRGWTVTETADTQLEDHIVATLSR